MNHFIILSSLGLLLALNANAQTAQQTMDENMRNAEQASSKLEQERTSEQMRDKSHDGRLKAGNETSVGGNQIAGNETSVDGNQIAGNETSVDGKMKPDRVDVNLITSAD